MERRERSSPWMDEDFAAARSRAFLAALDLHRAVLAAEPGLMRRAARRDPCGKRRRTVGAAATLLSWPHGR